MPPFGPVSRRELIRCLRQLGFEGPTAGGRHAFMEKGVVKVIVPNPHHGDINTDLLARILRDANISRSEWEAV